MRDNAPGWYIAEALSLGLLTPVIPYAVEMVALRRMPMRAFGVFMCAHPAISSIVGWVAFQQLLGLEKTIGTACVVAASVGSTILRRAA